MKPFALFSVCLVLLTACSETVSETRGTFTTSSGKTYPTVTRTFQRSDGSSFARTTIRVGAERVSCIAGDRADCQSALFERSSQFARDR